jgi:hypothetical protein
LGLYPICLTLTHKVNTKQAQSAQRVQWKFLGV